MKGADGSKDMAERCSIHKLGQPGFVGANDASRR